VTDVDARLGLFPALLKHWRNKRGLSQLDLGVAADVSARHISFLETGRSNPSPEMVLLLGATLGVPLAQVNAMLRAAGHDPAFDEPDDQALPPSVAQAVELLKQHQEPYPLVVVDACYNVRDLNLGALRLFGLLLDGDTSGGAPVDDGPGGDATGGEAGPVEQLNLARLCFDPDGAHPVIVNFDEVGRQLLWRIQREVLEQPDDGALRQLLDDLLAYATVADDWRQADLSVPSDPALVIHLRRHDLEFRFLTLVTAFQAPQNVAVEQLMIETWFPADQATVEAVAQLAST
jgi:transcriptional regulator with XRE-family HTH domain